MKIGLALGSPYDRLESYELELDIAHAARVDSIWLPDHLWGFYHPGLWDRMSYNDAGCSPDAFADPLVLAGILGQKTALPLGTIVTDATRRRAPDMVRAALTVHHMCPGGYLLGVGSGEAENNLPFGYPFDKPVSRLEQFLIEARSLLDHGRMPAPLHGTMGLPSSRDGVGTMPLWVAAHGPRAMRLVGTYADGWISIFIDPDTFKAQRDTIAEHAAAAGRPAPATRCTVLLVLGESRDEVIERFEAEPLAKLITMTAPAALWKAFGLTKPGGGAGYSDMLIHDLPPEELAEIAPKIPIEMVEALGVFLGSAGEIAARLEPYRTVGVEAMVVANYSGFVGGLQRVADMKQQFVDLTQLLDVREEDGNE